MIGNIVTFNHDAKEFVSVMYGKKEKQDDYFATVTGLVVDAYTDVSGSMKGSSAFGFGDASGRTRSDRTYKILVLKSSRDFSSSTISWERTTSFVDVYHKFVNEIIKYGALPSESDENFKWK